MPDFTSDLYKLARADQDGEDRVYSWRKVLKEVHDAGWQEGYAAAAMDAALKDQLKRDETTDAH